MCQRCVCRRCVCVSAVCVSAARSSEQLLLVSGKMLSGEEDGLEDDPERADLPSGSFTGERLASHLASEREGGGGGRGGREKEREINIKERSTGVSWCFTVPSPTIVTLSHNDPLTNTV